ncbi:class I SAM-dependent methyltransferase [Geodermatophilus obscurus]|uniref:Methyltransferase type 11 n=1 Tax=Geodermatophilus obscurus (strain ATCC 25078 / DSM 43160 / JCM 3152 / CCUG 61914 / KCC A-0152 / KCTC 9177 / NBRC 13315 / NRRL B-3577 / G-20) TaxID=526225 RepID=D2S8S8_GEOOG|nr:class I SAM-dependent methyltransferase [Geodermatophilus obscurus]ADB75659.1 Methyltransferase type 11 [Geodermatophilus obscurus DSM 43160]
MDDAAHRRHAELGFDEASWEERYRIAPALWSGRANPQLVAEAADLPPGRALDAGSGEGGDALWLAGRGWRVTAVDFSTVALGRAAVEAGRLGIEVDWVHADLTRWAPPEGAFDLVSAQYLHLPGDDRDPVVAGLAAAVAPGGSLLVVGHRPSEVHVGRPEMFFTAQQVAATLDPDAWDVVVCEDRPRTASGPAGRELPVADTVLRARRRA